ncbi:MAG: oligosaccharide flippase family protein [Geodermatophilaceae bacterium]
MPGTGDHADMTRHHVRGSALLLVGRILSLLISTATQIIIVRALTKVEYGGFAYALALASAGRTLLSLGQGKLLSRFMAGYEEQRDYNRMFGSMVLAIGTIVVTSTLTMVALFAFSDVLIFSAVQDSRAVAVVLILVFVAPMEALDQVFVSLFAVFSRPLAIFFRKFLLSPLLRFGVVLLLVITDASVVFLAIGYVISGLVGLLVYVGILIRVLRERDLLKELKPRKLIMPYRAVFGFSFPLITGELVLLSLNTGGVLVLVHFQPIVEVASYRAVFNGARLNTAILTAFTTLFLPMAARLFARSDIDGLRRTYWHSAAFVAVLTFPIFALTGPLAPQTTVLLFGARYADSSAVLALLAVGYYFNVMLGFNAFTLQVCGRIRYLVGVNVFVALLNIAVSLLLVRDFGAVGIAAANCVALATQNILNQLALRRSIGTGFIARRYLGCYLLIALFSAALWAFQLLIEPSLLLSLAAATVASCALLMSCRNVMGLAESFPELSKVPVVRWLIR